MTFASSGVELPDIWKTDKSASNNTAGQSSVASIFKYPKIFFFVVVIQKASNYNIVYIIKYSKK